MGAGWVARCLGPLLTVLLDPRIDSKRATEEPVTATEWKTPDVSARLREQLRDNPVFDPFRLFRK